MYMNYIVFKNKTLEGVAGDDTTAKKLVNALNGEKDSPSGFRPAIKIFYNYSIYSLNQLIEKQIEIPQHLAWIVESDRKHQQREIDSRNQNITDKNALNYAPGGCALRRE